MNLQPPVQSSFAPPAGPRNAGAAWFIAALLVFLLCAWQLFGLPGAVLKKVRVPEDMLEFGFGLASVQVGPEGEWIIRRQAYADRMGRYDISPDGLLTRSKERGLVSEPNRTGTMVQPYVRMEGHSYIDVAPGPAYYSQRRELRRLAGKLTSKGKPLLNDSTDPRGPLPGERIEPKVIGAAAQSGHFIALNILRVSRWLAMDELPQSVRGEAQLQYQLLEGHDFYAVIDSAAYKAPDLWLTSDRGQFLHHIRASEKLSPVPEGAPAEAGIEIEVLQSIPLKELIPVQKNGVILGHDPHSQRLFLVLPSGERLWFQPDDLSLLGRDKLPGFWEREYGALTYDVVQRLEYPNYNMESGWPLTETAFKRIQRVMVLLMLGGLVAMACLWRTPWRFISAATTAASNSSSAPLST
ncbi:hypothetical protein IT575_07100 [bacterium]|nr:hypothetical protein [bacterium]